MAINLTTNSPRWQTVNELDLSLDDESEVLVTFHGLGKLLATAVKVNDVLHDGIVCENARMETIAATHFLSLPKGEYHLQLMYRALSEQRQAKLQPGTFLARVISKNEAVS